jgi:hypothetical protein
MPHLSPPSSPLHGFFKHVARRKIWNTKICIERTHVHGLLDDCTGFAVVFVVVSRDAVIPGTIQIMVVAVVVVVVATLINPHNHVCGPKITIRRCRHRVYGAVAAAMKCALCAATGRRSGRTRD